MALFAKADEVAMAPGCRAVLRCLARLWSASSIAARDDFRASQVVGARLGDRHRPGRAGQQRDPDLLLQSGDDPGRRWLRQPEFAAGDGEAPRAGNPYE